MKDTPRPHILSKFQPKIWKFLVIRICPKSLYSQKTQSGPLGVNDNEKWVDMHVQDPTEAGIQT